MVIVNGLVSKIDDNRPWNKETPLLDKENNEDQDKSLFLSVTALLIIVKIFILG
jgi:hypothetical protein